MKADVLSEDGSSEVDLVVYNTRLAEGLPSFDSSLLVECKNWERVVSSHDIAWFDWKMRLGGQKMGILVAANGITASSSRRGVATSIITLANADGANSRQILVLQMDELRVLSSTEELRDLLIDKTMRLAARDPF